MLIFFSYSYFDNIDTLQTITFSGMHIFKIKFADSRWHGSIYPATWRHCVTQPKQHA